MSFFGMELTDSGDVVEPKPKLQRKDFDIHDIKEIEGYVKENGKFKLGQTMWIHSREYLKDYSFDTSAFPYWILEIDYHTGEKNFSGYHSVIDAFNFHGGRCWWWGNDNT